MKKFAKLLAAVLAFAMVASVMVMPVSASTAEQQAATYVAPSMVELFGEWGFGPKDFESKTNESGKLYGWNYTLAYGNVSNYSPALGYNNPEEGIGVNGSKAAKWTLAWKSKADATNYTNDGARLLWVALEPGATYELTADIKIDSETDVTAQVSAHADASHNGTSAINKIVANAAMDANYKTVNNKEFKTVKEYITVTERNLNGLTANRAHAHIGFCFSQASYKDQFSSIIVDNWTLTKLPGKNLSNNSLSVQGTAATATQQADQSWLMDFTANGSASIRQNSIVVNASTTYYVTALIKDADGVLNAQPTVAFHNGHNCYATAASGMKTTDNTIGADWKRFTGYITCREYKSGYYTEDLKGQDICATASHKNYTNAAAHLGLQITNAKADEQYLVKDFACYPVSADTTATVTPAATEDVEGETTVTVAFSDTAELTESGITVTGGPANVALTKVSPKLYTIALSGLANESDYKVAVSAKDMFAIPVAAEGTFKTKVPPVDMQYSENLASKWGIDGNFNTLKAFADGQTTNLASFSLDEEVSYDEGGKSLKFVATGAGGGTGSARWTSLSLTSLGLDPTDYTQYIELSFWAKTAEGTNTVANYWSQSSLSTNKWRPIGSKSGVSINADEWTKVTACFKVDEMPGSNKSADNGAHFGFHISGAGTVYVDNYEVKVMKPLNVVDGYMAALSKDGDKLSIVAGKSIEGEATPVYLVAAKYDGAKMTNVKIAKTTAPLVKDSGANPGYAEIEGIDDTYKVFILDGSLNPLNMSCVVSNIQ